MKMTRLRTIRFVSIWKLRAAAEAANTSRAGMNSMSTHDATAVALGGEAQEGSS
jgi:hypothetical protein